MHRDSLQPLHFTWPIKVKKTTKNNNMEFFLIFMAINWVIEWVHVLSSILFLSRSEWDKWHKCVHSQYLSLYLNSSNSLFSLLLYAYTHQLSLTQIYFSHYCTCNATDFFSVWLRRHWMRGAHFYAETKQNFNFSNKIHKKNV